MQKISHTEAMDTQMACIQAAAVIAEEYVKRQAPGENFGTVLIQLLV
jgi:hypothetical protein